MKLDSDIVSRQYRLVCHGLHGCRRCWATDDVTACDVTRRVAAAFLWNWHRFINNWINKRVKHVSVVL